MIVDRCFRGSGIDEHIKVQEVLYTKYMCIYVTFKLLFKDILVILSNLRTCIVLELRD
jgi:hypothetical protein